MLGSVSTGIPRPSSATVIEPSRFTVTWITLAQPAMTSSTELSTTSVTRWCRPRTSRLPMYMPDRSRTCSRSLM